MHWKWIIYPVNNARVWYSWLSEGYVSFQGENWNSKFISNFLYLCSSLMLNVLGFVQVWEKKTMQTVIWISQHLVKPCYLQLRFEIPRYTYWFTNYQVSQSSDMIFFIALKVIKNCKDMSSVYVLKALTVKVGVSRIWLLIIIFNCVNHKSGPRSTEEIFALFISLAFTVDAVSSILKGNGELWIVGCVLVYKAWK